MFAVNLVNNKVVAYLSSLCQNFKAFGLVVWELYQLEVSTPNCLLSGIHRQFCKISLFDQVWLWIRLCWLNESCRQFYKISKLSCCMSFGLVQLQLWIKLVAAVCSLKTVIAMNNFFAWYESMWWVRC